MKSKEFVYIPNPHIIHTKFGIMTSFRFINQKGSTTFLPHTKQFKENMNVHEIVFNIISIWLS